MADTLQSVHRAAHEQLAAPDGAVIAIARAIEGHFRRAKPAPFRQLTSPHFIPSHSFIPSTNLVTQFETFNNK
ncbi:hypothetical protein [Calditerricola satsumensis]|uniref:hypothetical protein n=1 Tax=Calditerricola satsumensis TaxID=373054 RepID=UPI00155DBD4D|nr:hypothetical protein [Calditerricola satsumensis]